MYAAGHKNGTTLILGITSTNVYGVSNLITWSIKTTPFLLSQKVVYYHPIFTIFVDTQYRKFTI